MLLEPLILGIIFLITFVIFIGAVIYLIQGPPFVRSSDESATQVIKMVQNFKSRHILDMGSGDGKLVILLAQKGYKVDGIELNPLLVFRSRRAIKNAGVEKNAKIYWGNFWSVKTSKYDLIVLYAIKHIMGRLEEKLKSELKPGAHIVSNFFIFPNLKPIKRTELAVGYKI